MRSLLVRPAFRLLISPAWWLVRGALLDAALAHVAQAGFAPQPFERAGGRLAGIVWQGRTLAATDTLPSAEAHYLRHMVVRPEWPYGTTLPDYLVSIAIIIRDPASGVFVSRYRGRWHLAVVRRSGPFQGPGGFPFVMVEYRVHWGYWMTAFQPANGLQHFTAPSQEEPAMATIPALSRTVYTLRDVAAEVAALPEIAAGWDTDSEDARIVFAMEWEEQMNRLTRVADARGELSSEEAAAYARVLDALRASWPRRAARPCVPRRTPVTIGLCVDTMRRVVRAGLPVAQAVLSATAPCRRCRSGTAAPG